MLISHQAELRVTKYLCEWALPSVVFGVTCVIIYIHNIDGWNGFHSKLFAVCQIPYQKLWVFYIRSQISKNIEPVIWGLCIEVWVASHSNDDNDNEMPPTPMRTSLINKFGGIMILYVVVGESS